MGWCCLPCASTEETADGEVVLGGFLLLLLFFFESGFRFALNVCLYLAQPEGQCVNLAISVHVGDGK
jgi:hypothetical protein